jgi:putative OPT family oligopeptide transporter
MKTQQLLAAEGAAITELTLRGIILGIFITIIFTASNVYLGLKVGLTFSSSIPAAVISMAILQLFRQSTILENNMVQTQASAAGSLASVIFTLPGLVMIGYWQGFQFWQTMIICTTGSILGVIFSIPLRHVMVVKSDLPYPEGVAAAEILRVGTVLSQGKKMTDKTHVADSGFKNILSGSAIAAVFTFCTNGLRVFSEGISYWFSWGKAIFQLPMGFSLALVGAGYLVGTAPGIAMLIGVFISWGIIVPYLTTQATLPIDVSVASFATEIWKSQVRFVGAGALAVAAIWTLITLFKPMVEGMKLSFAVLRSASGKVMTLPRTETDLSPRWIITLTVLMILMLISTFYSFIADASVSTGLGWVLVGAATLTAVIIGFLVAAACGYMAGLVGSSASPISGIGIIAIIVTALVILAVNHYSPMLATDAERKFATALAIFITTAVVAIATISNDNLQDLKTGWLVGATPWRQQLALIIGCVVGALVIAPVLEILYHAYGFAGALPRVGMDTGQILSAPQATLMTTIAIGIFSHQLKWQFIITGLILGMVFVLIDHILKRHGKIRLPVLAVGMGLYLPPSLVTPIAVGSLLAWYVKRKLTRQAKAKNISPTESLKVAERRGTLFAAGLIVGESLIGVLLAIIIVISISSGGSDTPLAIVGEGFSGFAPWLTMLCFAGVCMIYLHYALQKDKAHPKEQSLS